MRRIIPLIMYVLVLLILSAITLKPADKNLLSGKWKLVKWTYKEQPMDVAATYKTEEVYEILKEDNVFVSIIGEKVMEGDWSFNESTKELKINAGPVKVAYLLESVNDSSRVVSSSMIGVLEYIRVEK